ncbi:hypothetical protein J6590_087824 [Homalodisca vitripennis]|nr:hypothetical protein J6590_087824 [Homalodisca vitripennis]
MRHLKYVVAFTKQHRPSYQRNAAPCQCVNRKDAVPSTVVNELFGVCETSEVCSHSASRNDRATKETQLRVNVSIGRMPYRQTKDAVPSTVVNESLSVSEEMGRMATSYIPSDWRLFTYISISKGSCSKVELNFFTF